MAESRAARDSVPDGDTTTHLRLLRAALAGYLLLVLRITQWPRLADPADLDRLADLVAWWHAHGLPTAIDLPVVEAVANVAMFVPFGILLPLAVRWPTWPVVPLGAAFSTAIELSQLMFFPERIPSPQDVVMNTLGAALGVAALAALRRGGVARVGAMEPEPRPSLLRPSRLQPFELDLRRVFWFGVALWAVATALTTALAAAGQVSWRAVAISATGLGLGFLALLWEGRRRPRTPGLLDES